MSNRSGLQSWCAVLTAIVVVVGIAGCGRSPVAGTACHWWVGRDEPAFDPDGSADATRWMLERLMTRGLVDADSSGRIASVAAEKNEVSPDGLVYTFHLRPDLAFSDGTPCKSEHFRRALEGGLGLPLDGTRTWLLGAVTGVEQVRAGKPLPKLGIETPDPRTLVIRLDRPDSTLLQKLALPGVSAVWKERAGDWADARGLGPYRMAQVAGSHSMMLIRMRHADAEPDTIHVHFATNAGRVRTALRQDRADLVWPLPIGLLSEPIPPGYRTGTGVTDPPRRLLLVMRADLPPTTRVAARHALAHSLNRGEILTALGPAATELREWLPGAGTFEFPSLDPGEVQRWMETGKLGRSFHVVMAFDAQGPAAEIARELQGEWARYSIYVELKPLRGRMLAEELARGGAHLVLADAQSLFADPVADLATLVMPVRGPAVGGLRTGWRTREFDGWIAPRKPAPEFPVAEVQHRLEQELIVLPLAGLPWLWIERDHDSGVRLDSRFGPLCAPPPQKPGRSS